MSELINISAELQTFYQFDQQSMTNFYLIKSNHHDGQTEKAAKKTTSVFILRTITDKQQQAEFSLNTVQIPLCNSLQNTIQS
eukprot:m.65419 g.65419  ORF g.65419 m.65419 type:complete len:82 (+) comp35318_c0_seq1:197-442(+)